MWTMPLRRHSCASCGEWALDADAAAPRPRSRPHLSGDDVGARNHLQQWLHLEGPLTYMSVRQSLARWQEYGGLIYFHLLLDRLAEAGYLAT